MKLQVYRTNVSSYQNSLFLSNEKRVIEEIPGVRYIQSLQEIEKNVPFILISNTHTKPKELPDNILKNTVLMIHPNSGHDNIPEDFLREVSFPVVVGNPIRSNAVCEFTLGCIFQHFTKIPNHQYWPTARNWERKLLRDQKVMILGYGHIGKLLSDCLTPICREVRVYDPLIKTDSTNVQTIWNEDLFQDISILIIAASLTKSSNQLIGHNILKKLASENLIINPARGEIIIEKELEEYLAKNPKSFCFLDVFEKEPFDPGHLNELSNINKTAHIAGVYNRLNKDIISFEYLVIKDFMDAYLKDDINDFQTEYQDCLLNPK